MREKLSNEWIYKAEEDGEEATVEESKEAVIRMKEVRKFIRKKMGYY
ncbi:hypothetical protein KAX02_11960 [candidate division WOR-3 bacterium]|nr:hypothetical protein [candidate division WOR-3 bacterium]